MGAARDTWKPFRLATNAHAPQAAMRPRRRLFHRKLPPLRLLHQALTVKPSRCGWT
jgi:hypothetical protein